jgi:hypothetical protein
MAVHHGHDEDIVVLDRVYEFYFERLAGLIRKHGTMPSQEELARLMAEHGTFLAAT